MPPLVQFFGRLHPMVLHAPIGLLIALAAVESAAIIGKKPLSSSVRATLAWLAAIAAALTAGAGLVLSLEDAYTAQAVQWHQWLGIAVAASCVLAAAVQQFGKIAPYRAVLAVALILVVPAGHLGASITHGADFLTEPFAEARPARSTQESPSSPSPATESPQAPTSTYASIIAPILNSRCIKCHGNSKQKGGLALNMPDGIRKGGKSGPVLVAGDPNASEMIRRMTLPTDDDDHMPPEGKPQPNKDEIRAIEDWIAGGASFEGEARPALKPGAAADTPIEPPAPETSLPAAPVVQQPKTPEGPAAVDASALKALRDALVHVEPVQQGSTLLVIDFSAVATRLTEAELIKLLEPVSRQVADLSLARSKAGDDLLALAAKMPELTRLNLTGTQITDAGLKSLEGHKKLQDLILTQTHLTNAADESLAAIPSLKRVYAWKSGLDAEALTGLRDKGVLVDIGEAVAAKAEETEQDIKLTNSAPAPPSGDALKPVNTVCPVSGKPVDPKYLIVYKGRVIGFCCNHCPEDFWANPEKYESKLP